MKITSLQNGRIKEAVKLRDRKGRDDTDLFLIEGYREIERAIGSGHRLEAVFYCPELFLGVNEIRLLQISGAELVECTREVFAKLSYRDRPDG